MGSDRLRLSRMPSVGKVYVALFSMDARWYRVKVCKVLQNSRCEVRTSYAGVLLRVRFSLIFISIFFTALNLGNILMKSKWFGIIVQQVTHSLFRSPCSFRNVVPLKLSYDAACCCRFGKENINKSVLVVTTIGPASGKKFFS